MDVRMWSRQVSVIVFVMAVSWKGRGVESGEGGDGSR